MLTCKSSKFLKALSWQIVHVIIRRVISWVHPFNIIVTSIQVVLLVAIATGRKIDGWTSMAWCVCYAVALDVIACKVTKELVFIAITAVLLWNRERLVQNAL